MQSSQKYILLFIIFLLGNDLFAQQEDTRWTCGQFNAILDFSNPDTVQLPSNPELFLYLVEPLSSLVELAGDKMYVSNSVNIVSDFKDTIRGTEHLLHSIFRNRYSSGPVAPDFTLLLPKKQGEFYTINRSGNGAILDPQQHIADHFSFYGVINMDSMKVVSAQNKLRNDTMQVVTSSFLASTRHANGRDFWIVEKAWKGNRYYIYRTTPDTIVLEHIQVIGDSTGEWDVYGGGRFSPQGDKLAFTCSTQFPQIFDFDRCSGRLSKPIKLLTPVIDRNGISTPISIFRPNGGLSINFSPSGRFLYFNTLWRIDQYDMWKQHPDSIIASRYAVAQWDSSYLNTGACATYEPFNRSLNAINGKMYFSVFNPPRCIYLHVVNNPDGEREMCDFRLFSQKTNSSYPSSSPLPNLPYYALKAKVGSGCDTAFTTGVSELGRSIGFELYPNPASAMVRVKVERAGEVVVYDILGKEVLRTDVDEGEQTIAIGHLSGGIYQAVLLSGSQRAVRRLVVW